MEQSNLSEEKSGEIQNISSIKSNELPIPKKARQKQCRLCHKGKEENLSDLIYPCLCNIMTHRKCLKRYIITNCEIGCEKCRTNYAIGKSNKLIINQMKPKLITSLFWKLFRLFLLFLTITIVIIYLSRISTILTDFEENWRIFLYILVSFLYILTLIYMFLTLRIFCKRLGIKDIEVFCYQTEIAKHTRDSRRIITEFLEKMHLNEYEISEMEDSVKPPPINNA